MTGHRGRRMPQVCVTLHVDPEETTFAEWPHDMGVDRPF